MTTTPISPKFNPNTPGIENAHHSHAWRTFTPGPWQDAIDVRDFIVTNYTPYTGDGESLAGPTPRTTAHWDQLTQMFPAEREKGVYDVDAQTPSTITSHAPGYINKDSEVIVGDRKSTRLNSSHVAISYAVFCLKKKTQTQQPHE